MNYERDHGLKVSELATSLYRQLSPLHRFGDSEEELLKYSALLHDIGYFLSRSGHHKHGQYFIMNAGLSGFSNDELFHSVHGLVVLHHKVWPFHHSDLCDQGHERQPIFELDAKCV